MKQIIAGLLIFAAAVAAQAREVQGLSYQQMYDQADLVVIAKPVSTQDTTEKTTLREMPRVHFIGLSTEFDIRLVMKGDTNVKKCVLHHYRLANPIEAAINGPDLASFDPTKDRSFLLFLHRERDGRYSPVSGQIDPATFSVLRLGGLAD